MKIDDLRQILSAAEEAGNIKSICFEGGEPFLYYPTMLWGLREAKKRGFRRLIVTNAYWATSIEDAREWLAPIAAIGIHDLSISDDLFHYGKTEENLAKHAYEAAAALGLPVGKIVIEEPKVQLDDRKRNGEPVVGGGVQFKGRAVETLAEGLPRKPWTAFAECLDEDFANQARVHIDPYGYVHVCQGITIGNMKRAPLGEILTSFDPLKHPICAPILRGGPAELAREHEIEPSAEGFVDACHLCYVVRSKLRPRFSEILAPAQLYGA
jgi:MoaA/NifB/PqqE/SkfB family radical SAM enzyme